MKSLWLVAGHLSLFAGVVGIVVPLLPTTPFLILAAYLYSRGSGKFEKWLVTHPRLGPSVRAWRESGAICGHAKVLAGIAIGLSAMLLVFASSIPLPARSAAWVMLAGVGTFVLSRPVAKAPAVAPKRVWREGA